MFAIVEIGKKQYFVEKGHTYKVERLSQKEGEITLDKVLLVAGDKVDLGLPYVKGATVKAQINGEQKGVKVLSYKYRRRKKSRRIRGHRQIYTLLKISDIIVS
ncbi:MAG: 50S ribosomal protein L21 [Candidatus Omnitrophica bacterium]|nr:50S ribosomal protein L21 [Candidatus Omnitrophota bacterium]